MFLRGGNRPARRDPKTGELILEEPRVLNRFFWIMIIGFPNGIAILAFADPPPPGEHWIPWFAAASCVGLGMLGISATVCVRVSAEGIRKEGPFSRKRHILWQEVASVTMDASGSPHISSSKDTRIIVETNLVGIAELPDILERHLPHDVLRNCEVDLIAFREFVS
jgi:hypothetical protein